MNHDLLKSIYLFSGMTSEMLKQIAEICVQQVFNRGDIIFTQGDKATALYIIKFGSVRIQKKSSSGDEIEVAVLGTGSHFGEMSYIDKEPRSAGVEVLEKSEIIALEYDKFQNLLEKNPIIALGFYRAVCHFLCGRLRMSTNDLSFSRELNLKHF